jgi:molybdopterin-containing oxidoreductase family iron-sulfur binding subunit
MPKVNRRNFLKIMGITGTTALTACSAEPVRTIIPHLIPPDDIVPGTAVWYASTCRECPAGCGILAKNREGRVIKLEGNPLHPVNQGKLCARGQASLQGLYHPDRFREPLLRNSEGQLEPVSWDRAEQLLVRKLKELAARGKEDRAVFVTGLITGTMRDLVRRFLAAARSRRHISYEPFAYEPLRTAHQVVFGHNSIPSYAIDAADLIISFGADFLETWLSPVEYARQFAAFRSVSRHADHRFYYVGPRLSLTAASADRWIGVRPGEEYAIALGMLRLALEDGVLSGLSVRQMEQLKATVRPWTRSAIEKMTGVKAETITVLARAFVQARNPLALAGCFSGERPVETAVAADLLCLIKQGTHRTMDFSNTLSISEAAPAAEMKLLADSDLLPTSLLVTFGAAGAVWDGLRVEGVVVPEDEVVDTVGAGDAFCGALAAALAAGGDRESALHEAARAGAAAVRWSGAQPDPHL